MARLSRITFALVMFTLALSMTTAAQESENGLQAQAGDPPLASLISISPPDADGLVTITGQRGSVPATAQLSIRNLYTEETIYTQASIGGNFSASLFGFGNTPYWISPADAPIGEFRDRPGSLPGGPGTIIYSDQAVAPPELVTPQPTTEAAPTLPVTQLVTDGAVADWAAYPQGLFPLPGGQSVYALRNPETLYLAVAAGDLPADYFQVDVVFTLDGVTYGIRLDPRVAQVATWRQVAPNQVDLGTLAVPTATGDGVIEMRIPLSPISVIVGSTAQNAVLNSITFLNQSAAELVNYPVEREIPIVDEIDGIVRLDSALAGDFVPFQLSGTVARRAGRWTAEGRIQSLSLNPGGELILEMDVTMDVPALPTGIVGLQMIGRIGLQPVIGPDGFQVSGGLHTNNGWSNVLTPSGLPINDLGGDFILGEAVAPAPRIIRRGNQLFFPLTFVMPVPSDLPDGLYVPYFQGRAQVADGEIFRWEDNSILGAGVDISRLPLTRLPLVLNAGDVRGGRLLWTLFQDLPSNGSRGLIAGEDREQAALSSRTRFDSHTYILPPNANTTEELTRYPLEPYLVNLLSNAYDSSVAPLIPFDFPSGEISVQVTRPNGIVEDLGAFPLLQNRLSTVEMDERARFGAQSPVDVYRLTTLSQTLLGYRFDEYGQYQINLAGTIEDVFGNVYTGGGTYSLLIAEPLVIYPGVLSGTPFEVGDSFNPGLRLQPNVEADVLVELTVYPLDGGEPIRKTFAGRTNRFGYFHPGADNFIFETAGEYLVDYEVRFADQQLRLWAGSLRGAGVIAQPEGSLVAHGARGSAGYYPDERPAWYILNRYAQDAPEDTALYPNYPYHAGDIVWLEDGRDSGLNPVVQGQDLQGAYAGWLVETQPFYRSIGGLTMERLAAEDELPLSVFNAPGTVYGPALEQDNIVNNAYTYISAVRPGVTARQFVIGANDSNLPLAWDADDPYNRQIGAGSSGDLPGDYLFLFGGAVIRNTDLDLRDAVIYGAVAVVIPENDGIGTRVLPPYRGQAGGADGGPLLTVRGEPLEIFFHPTGTQPGQILTEGDILAVAGQVAPALPAQVAVRVVSPGGDVREFTGRANAIGYFYDDTRNFALDEIGVWTVEITVTNTGVTSAGQLQPPYPTGGVPGAINRRYQVYVIPQASGALPWDRGVDAAFPPVSAFNFSFRLPDDWTDIRVYRTLTTPGFVLEDGEIPSSGRAFDYAYSPVNLSALFPNLQGDSQTSGPAASKSQTLTFVAVGTDANGQQQILSRTFTIWHDRIITFD